MSAKQCKSCTLILPLSAFGKHKGRKLGLADSCKQCRNQAILLKRHKITQEQKDSMLLEQNFCCAICGVHQDDCWSILAVDHCHKTGKIRGLLCAHCNHGLGNFKDNIEIIKNAIKYLKGSL